jgi:hypothetical protein
MKKFTAFVGLALFFFMLYAGLVTYKPDLFNGFVAEATRLYNLAVNFIQPYLF